MNKQDKIKLIKEYVEKALSKYDEENVDIVKDEDENAVDVVYHSRHNSFHIFTNICLTDDLTEYDISKIADYYDIGYVW